MNLDEQEVEAKELYDRLKKLCEAHSAMNQDYPMPRDKVQATKECIAHHTIGTYLKKAYDEMDRVVNRFIGPWI